MMLCKTRNFGLTLALSGALALGACAEVKETMATATARIDDMIGTDWGGSEAKTRYQAALAARQVGQHEAAFGDFLRAAELGHAAAAYEVGHAYAEGHGTAPDKNAAAEWIGTAAERGEPRAQYEIGGAHYRGSGVAQDYETAVQFLGKAAAQGHAEAQFLLGQAFADGHGVTANRAWATRWYGLAAAQGHGKAQFHYGLAHASGLGLPKNPEKAYGWLLLAEKNGVKQAKKQRSALESKLAEAQAERAEAWAAAFKPETSPDFADRPTVMYVQYVLNGLGYGAGPVDGLPGPRTGRAVKRYQETRGLGGDGEITPELVERLRAEPEHG